MGKLPAYLHYAKDWLTDPNLLRCSKAAKGVWQDILDVMFLNCVRGVACNEDGTPWADHEIARAIGGDLIENVQSINELIAKGVARRNSSGALFSRRMVADEKERTLASVRMRKHRNPSSDIVTANETVKLRPSSGDGKGTGSASKVLRTISEESISVIYQCYPRKVGKGAAYKAIAHALQRLLRGEDSPDRLFHSLDDATVYLVQRTRLFASTPAGQAGQYTPHAATWYGQRRYLDDEAEWSKRGDENEQRRSAKPQPTTQHVRHVSNEASIATSPSTLRRNGGGTGLVDGAAGNGTGQKARSGSGSGVTLEAKVGKLS